MQQNGRTDLNGCQCRNEKLAQKRFEQTPVIDVSLTLHLRWHFAKFSSVR